MCSSDLLIPSGVLYERCKNIIGNGVVINMSALIKEMGQFSDLEGRLFISDKAHMILPYHEIMDVARESKKGKEAIGTTGKGIGPSYCDKIARIGFRIGELKDFKKLSKKIREHIESIKYIERLYDIKLPDSEAIIEGLKRDSEILKPHIIDSVKFLWDAKRERKKILLEGAQGSMLDIDHGTYPFVTSSTTTASGACSGSGLAPRDIERVLGITKAYCTRVGNGPFPSEEIGDIGRLIGEKGFEFGTTTGRARRCGWFDCVAVKFACELNGCDHLSLMKLDVLDDMEEIKVCIGYERDGEKFSYMPSNMEDLKPTYRSFPGWSGSKGVREFDKLPKNAQNYIYELEKLVGCPISIVSTGPDRLDTIKR